MSSQQEPLVWKDFDAGIADSPHKGHGLFRNADIDSFPGALKTGKQPGTYFHKITSRTFTADAGTNICTASGALEDNGRDLTGAAVYFTTTGTLPAGLSTGTLYYLYHVSANTFKVCTSYKNSVGSAAGTVIDITDAGSGTHTVTQVAVGQIKWILRDPRNGNYFMLSSNGRVWFIPTGITAYLLANAAIDTPSSGVTAASGGGLALHGFSSTTAKYLFVFRNATIDVIDVFGNTQIEALAWSNGWQSLNSAAGSQNSHEAIKGQDDAIYFCDDRYVGSIIEVAGSTFDPATGGTYTYNNAALDLPAGEVANCLEELGTDLLIGGANTNKIYPWDRISDSFGLPVVVPETHIYKLENIGGTVYILAGGSGRIYKTQGTYVKEHCKLPIYLTNNGVSIVSSIVTWGGITSINGDLLVGVGVQTSGNSGVWRIKENGRMTIDSVPSTGSAIVYSIYGDDDLYYFGYNGGMDGFASALYGTALYTNLQTIAQSPLFKVGTERSLATYSRAEVVLNRIATDGQLKLSYRAGLIASFTELGTVTADSSTQVFEIDNIGINNLNNLQLQIEMNDGSSGQGDFIVSEIRLFP